MGVSIATRIAAPHTKHSCISIDKYQDGRLVKTVRTEETVYKVIYPKYKIGSAEITPAPTATPKVTEPPEDGGEE